MSRIEDYLEKVMGEEYPDMSEVDNGRNKHFLS